MYKLRKEISNDSEMPVFLADVQSDTEVHNRNMKKYEKIRPAPNRVQALHAHMFVHV